MKEPKCTMSVSGKHKWHREMSYIHFLKKWTEAINAKCTYCGMIDDRKPTESEEGER